MIPQWCGLADAYFADISQAMSCSAKNACDQTVPEFAGYLLDQWAYLNKVEWHYIAPDSNSPFQMSGSGLRGGVWRGSGAIRGVNCSRIP